MRLLTLTNPLMQGEDVRTVQQALIKDGFLKGVDDSVFGPVTAAAAKSAKYWFGYPISAVQPTAGQQLLNYLRGTEQLPLTYRLRRKARQLGTKEGKIAAQRASIAANARWSAASAAAIHYAQIRPIPVNSPVRTLPLTTDCSGWVTLLYKWAGAPDPNGQAYNGQGYTGTLLTHGRPIVQSQVQPGDLIIWGAYPGHHVAVCVEPGPDPLVCSHGSEPDPQLIFASAETKAQGRSYQWRTYL